MSTSSVISRATRAGGSSQAAKRLEEARVLQELERLCETVGVGGRLPRHTELMLSLNASERHVMRSLETLQRQGRIERRHGSGTYVLDIAAAPVASPAAPPIASSDSTAVVSNAIIAVARPDYAVFDRCMEMLYDKAALADLDVVCRLLGPERLNSVSPESFGNPRGFIVFRSDLAPLALQLQELGHRVVLVGAPHIGQSFGVPCVYGHQELGGYFITKHLIDLGHRSIVYADISGDLRNSLRWRGHEKALREASRGDVVVKSKIVGAETLEEWRDSPNAAVSFFRKRGGPTAIAAWNDSEAIKINGTLGMAGISVPNEVSLTGYDNLIEGTWMHPALTTVDHLLDQQIATALDMIMSGDPLTPLDRLVFAPSLIARESSASPAATAK